MIRVLGYTHTRVSPQHWWAAVAFAAAATSLLWTPEPGWAALKLSTLALAYILGTWLVPEYVWLAYGYIVLASPAIYLVAKPNPTVISVAAALAFVGSVVYKLWILAVLSLGLLIVFPSRGAAMAVGAFAIAYLWPKSRSVAITIAFCGIALLLALKYSSDGSGGNSLYQRLGVWQDTFDHITPWGTGFGSFADAYASWPVHRNAIGNIVERAAHAYSDPLEIILELGAASIAVWAMLVYAVATGTREFRLIALTFGIMSLTYFPFSIPLVGHIFMFALGGAEEDKW